MSHDTHLPPGPNRHGVDLGQIVRNATAEGIDFSEIALLYQDLNPAQLAKLKLHGLYVDESARCVRGRFTREGLVMFPDNVASILHL
jgi:hypothetical protein